MYLYPKIDKKLGALYPSTEEIAKAIARRDKARIIPTGIYDLDIRITALKPELLQFCIPWGQNLMNDVGRKANSSDFSTPLSFQ
ncbi:MAG: DUF6088 family protein [Bacteroidales bacterium]|nr:DUF6088 family protein [Bacteroidales bacterium]